jgi:hypothetical protein
VPRVVHIIGNGDNASLFLREERKGLKIACNQTPFPIQDKYATVMVDFKFMMAMMKGSVKVDGKWICGFRPKKFLEDNPIWHMKVAGQIKEYYTHLPKYAIPQGGGIGQGYTNFNCGHVATHYACTKIKPDIVHMYGFDSIFDFNMRSFSDLVLASDRGNTNNNRLAGFWRPIWTNMWNEFKDIQFILHHTHDKFKVAHGDNVTCKIYSPLKESERIDFGADGLPKMDDISEA